MRDDRRGRYRGGFRDNDRFRNRNRRDGDNNNRGYKRKRDDGDNFAPRQPEMTPDERLRRLLIRVGEKSKASLTKNLDGLAKAVQVDIQQYEDLILDTIFDCVLHLGVKIPIHATLVGLITVWEPDFGAKVVNRLKDGFIASIEEGDFSKLRHFVRFLGCLQNANVVMPADFAKVLQQIMELLQNEEIPQKEKDHFAHIVMSSLIFSGQMLSENCQADLTQMFEALKTYMEARSDDAHPMNKPLSSQSITFLTDYWQGLQDLEKNDWKVDSVLKPHEDFERLKKCQQQPFLVEEFPTWKSPTHVQSVNRYGVMKMVEVEDALPLAEHCIVCEYLFDLMVVFRESPQYAAEHIINLPVSFDHKFLAMEAIFSYMLALPQPQQSYVFYARIIIELFDIQPKTWPKAVGRCLLHLFEKMEFMDPEVRDRLAHWFAFHLNNFGNNWPWHKWNFVVNLTEDSPKRVFCVQVLRLQMQLGEWGKVMNSVQDPFNTLMPSPPTPSMKYVTKMLDAAETNQKSDNQLAADLIRSLNRKLSVDDVQKYIETWFDPAIHGKYGITDIFFTCLLQVGHSSHSHFLSYFKAYQGIIREYAPNDEAKVVLLRALFRFWEKSQDRIVVLIEKLHQYKLINSSAVVQFIFEKSNIKKHTDPFWMHLLCLALDRVFLTNVGLQDRLALVKAKMTVENQAELEPKVEQIEAALEKLRPMLFRILEFVFRGFKDSLSEILADADPEELETKNYLYLATQGNMVWISRKYQRNIEPHKNMLEEKLFAGECEQQIRDHWNSIWNRVP